MWKAVGCASGVTVAGWQLLREMCGPGNHETVPAQLCDLPPLQCCCLLNKGARLDKLCSKGQVSGWTCFTWLAECFLLFLKLTFQNLFFFLFVFCMKEFI